MESLGELEIAIEYLKLGRASHSLRRSSMIKLLPLLPHPTVRLMSCDILVFFSPNLLYLGYALTLDTFKLSYVCLTQ